MPPWLHWNFNESATRSGINEMKHIEGLYAFLDYLLAHKPSLVIDNCAGGGRRLDFEMQNGDTFSICRAVSLSNPESITIVGSAARLRSGRATPTFSHR